MLDAIGVSHLVEGFLGEVENVVGRFHQGVETAFLGAELMPVDVRRNWQATVGPVAEKGLESRFAEESKDFQFWRDVGESAKGIGLPGAGRTLDEAVNSRKEG